MPYIEGRVGHFGVNKKGTPLYFVTIFPINIASMNDKGFLVSYKTEKRNLRLSLKVCTGSLHTKNTKTFIQYW